MKPRDPVSVTEVVDVFKMLANQRRLHLLLLLAHHGELSLAALSQATGQSPAAVRHHLTILCLAGLAVCQRTGKDAVYAVRSEVARQVLDFVLSEPPETAES